MSTSVSSSSKSSSSSSQCTSAYDDKFLLVDIRLNKDIKFYGVTHEKGSVLHEVLSRNGYHVPAGIGMSFEIKESDATVVRVHDAPQTVVETYKSKFGIG